MINFLFKNLFKRYIKRDNLFMFKLLSKIGVKLDDLTERIVYTSGNNIFNYMIEKKLISYDDKFQMPAIISAVEVGDYYKFKKLIGCVDKDNISISRALVVSVIGGRTNMAELILSKCKPGINNWEGEALYQACVKNDINMVRLLINHGADVTLLHNRALYTAVKNQNIDIVLLLLENGADIHDRDNYMLINMNRYHWVSPEALTVINSYTKENEYV